MKTFCLTLALGITAVSIAQGTLQFNQALLISSGSGTVTVPAGKVWKIEGNGLSGGISYSLYSTSYTTPTWSVTNPNPCNGATSGSSGTLNAYTKSPCPTSNNVIVINGVKTQVDANKPMWLPAGTTVSISVTPCVNSTSIAAGVPYYVRDQTTSTTITYYECDGPVNAGTVQNSIMLSILEFNIMP